VHVRHCDVVHLDVEKRLFADAEDLLPRPRVPILSPLIADIRPADVVLQ
jgi:hypothetical protein